MRKNRELRVTRRMLPLIVVALLALAMALPVLADGPPDKAQSLKKPDTIPSA